MGSSASLLVALDADAFCFGLSNALFGVDFIIDAIPWEFPAIRGGGSLFLAAALGERSFRPYGTAKVGVLISLASSSASTNSILGYSSPIPSGIDQAHDEMRVEQAGPRVNQKFAAIILGGTGQVGSAAVTEMLALPECREVVMVTRRTIAPRPRVRNIVLDTSADNFAERTARLAREVLNEGPVSAVSCVGIGSGSMGWSEEEIKRLELGVVGAFARGCHDAGIAQFCLLSAAGSTAKSRFRYVRVMGMKEDTVRSIGFSRLAIFRPGIIVGNSHTPTWVEWLGKLVPGQFGNIDQKILGRSIAAEIALHSHEAGEVIHGNAAMKRLALQLIA